MTSTHSSSVCSIFSALTLSIDRWSGDKTESKQRTHLTLEKAKVSPKSQAWFHSTFQTKLRACPQSFQPGKRPRQAFLTKAICALLQGEVGPLETYLPPVSKPCLTNIFMAGIFFQNRWLQLFLPEHLLPRLFIFNKKRSRLILKAKDT